MIKVDTSNIIFPFYHAVSNHEVKHLKHLFPYPSEDKFKEDLKFLLSKYKPTSFKEIIKGYSSKTTPSFLLSFDDGLKELYTVVYPILKELNIKPLAFLNSSFVNNKNLFHRFKTSLIIEEVLQHNLNLSISDIEKLTFNDQTKYNKLETELGLNFKQYLIEESPYLTSEQIIELKAAGWEFGAHSANHPEYYHITEEDQIKETLESLKYIEENKLSDYKTFAFPFTDDGVKTTFFRKIENHVDLTFGTAGMKTDMESFHIQRIPMEKNKSAKEIIRYQKLKRTIQRAIFKNKVTR